MHLKVRPGSLTCDNLVTNVSRGFWKTELLGCQEAFAQGTCSPRVRALPRPSPHPPPWDLRNQPPVQVGWLRTLSNPTCCGKRKECGRFGYPARPGTTAMTSPSLVSNHRGPPLIGAFSAPQARTEQSCSEHPRPGRSLPRLCEKHGGLPAHSRRLGPSVPQNARSSFKTLLMYHLLSDTQVHSQCLTPLSRRLSLSRVSSHPLHLGADTVPCQQPPSADHQLHEGRNLLFFFN